jgi:hypothetical protein
MQVAAPFRLHAWGGDKSQGIYGDETATVALWFGNGDVQNLREVSAQISCGGKSQGIFPD